MAQVEGQVPVTADSQPAPAKKEKKTTAKVVRAKPSHPPTSEMVNNAIKSLKERNGSSVQAIKKYLAANYNVEAEKIAPFVKKYLKSAVVSGALVQKKGKGASGSFKLAPAVATAKPAAAKKPAAKPKKVASPKKEKTEVKKVAKPKSPKKEAKPKVALKSKRAAPKTEKKTAAKAAPASPKVKVVSKVKKTKAVPTKKPKAPKPKTVKAAASPKKK